MSRTSSFPALTILFVTLLFLASCASVRVRYDYDRRAEFPRFTTYSYWADSATGLSELDERRLLRVLDSLLPTKGLERTDTPGMWIRITSGVYRPAPGTTAGVGVGGTGGDIGGGVTIGIPVNGSGLRRDITFTLLDGAGGEVFWEATGSTSFRDGGTPWEREEGLRRVVLKVFSKYPPD